MAMLAAALAPPLAAQARQYDPLRCEAIEMRKESQMYKCLTRCDRQDARRKEPSETKLLACQDRCDTHYQNSMDRLERREVCGSGDIDQAEPNRCTARLMRAEASALSCESRCGVRAVKRESFDEDSCLDKCDDHYDKTVDRLLSKSFCAGMDFPE
jgi:hypothetical protein